MCRLWPLQASHTASLNWASLALLWRWHCTSAPLQRPRHATCSRVAGTAHSTQPGFSPWRVAIGIAACSRLLGAGRPARHHWRCLGGGTAPRCHWQRRRTYPAAQLWKLPCRPHDAARSHAAKVVCRTAAQWPMDVPATGLLLRGSLLCRHWYQPTVQCTNICSPEGRHGLVKLPAPIGTHSCMAKGRQVSEPQEALQPCPWCGGAGPLLMAIDLILVKYRVVIQPHPHIS